MTQTTQGTPAEAARTAREIQRESLEKIATLSTECAAEEQRIEEAYKGGLHQENLNFEKTMRETEARRGEELEALAQRAADERETIKNEDLREREETESRNTAAQQQMGRKRKEADSTIKKQVEQTAWQAESVLVTLQMAVDQEEQKHKEEERNSRKELAALGTLEEAAQKAMGRYGLAAVRVEPAVDEGLKGRLDNERGAVLAEYREKTLGRLKELHELTAGRVVEDVGPWFLIVIAAALAAGIGWVSGHDNESRMWAAGGAAGGVIVLGTVMALILRSKKRKRVKEQARRIGELLMQEYALACEAARFDVEAAALARQRKVEEGQEKRDQAVSAATQKGRALQVRAAEEFKSGMAEQAVRYKAQLEDVERKKDTALKELEETRERTLRQVVEEAARAKEQEQKRHSKALEEIEERHHRETQELAERWKEGLEAVNELTAAGEEIDPRLVDWKSAAWDGWRPPKEFSGQVRFGEIEVDLARLGERVPAHLQLPGTLHVPALLEMPGQGSLYIESDHTGREAAMDAGRMAMTRLLTQMPAGRVKFTIFDPVGLGQSFAGFMHLADHDESLVGARIWTEKDHMQKRLADLTEHMETVIQKYLRNEYATIDQYNAQAGELAEPIRYLVLADFPTGFDQEMLRRLAGIALSGPRCGVYTIILRDVRQQLPAGSRMEDIIGQQTVKLKHKNEGFVWDDKVFGKFPLKVDAGPDEKTLTRLMDAVGNAAKEAKRVEVPFGSIAPKEGQFWSLSSKNELRVPMGKSGAMRLQSLRLGVGVAQHALVAGKTGSGKSNLMHTIVTNLAMWYGPEEVEFYLVDFKKGVEFKAYVTSALPHARAIAVESDREFGLSVLQRVDAELTRRGTLFRDAGVQEISSYRDKTGQSLPRSVLLIDEFQEFFSEEDKLSQEAAGLMDRLVRQGRAFGVHLVLGSQTIGGTSGLGRSTLGQIAVRVALQCTEADSQMILGDNNSAARLLTRPGEAIYNDAGGLVEANSPFQIAYLPEDTREKYLQEVRRIADGKGLKAASPIVFEGNSAAAIEKNRRLIGLLESEKFPAAASAVPAYVGEPVAIKEPTAVTFRRQSGVNVLMVGQQEESAVAIVASMVASLAAQHAPGDAVFYLMDGSPADSRYFGVLPKVLQALPHAATVVEWRDVPAAIDEVAKMLAERQGKGEGQGGSGPAVYMFIFGLQRYRLLRKQEEDFSFRKSEEPEAPKPDKQFAELLSEGPGLGLHTIVWADTPITVERTLERSAMRQFDNRILFQMSANDSSNLIDSPLANRLGTHRALLYREEQGTAEKFRPYEVPDEKWLGFLAERLKKQK